ncbi:MAG: extracellular solute-binding protein [Bifidobacteriaceae bacterium]|jgi:multiple sugar transport system substrate-binding protein|nr:extracellular solute-binding protein [Bifidobacteriaceae bacterium]
MRIKRRRLVAGAAIAACCAMTLVACGDPKDNGGGDKPAPTGDALVPNTTDPITLRFTWWGNDDRADRYAQAIDLFTAKYPNFTIETSSAAFADYWPARNTEAAGGGLPDVMQFDSAYLREYAGGNRLLDMKPYMDAGVIKTGDYEPNLVAAGNLGGKQIAIPTGTNTLAFFYQPDLTAETGVAFPTGNWTLEDYNAFCTQVKAANKTAGDQPIYCGKDYTDTFWFFLQYLVQKGVAPFTDAGELNFGEDEIKEFLAIAAPAREAGAFTPASRLEALSPLTGFSNNEAISEASWDNFIASFSGDTGKENLEIVPIWSGDNGRQNFMRPAMLISIGANTEHPAEAALLADFMLNDPEVGKIFGTSRGVPSGSTVREALSPEAGSFDDKVMAYEELVQESPTAAAPIPVKGFGTIEEKWRTLAQELGFGTINADQFASEWMAEAANAIK